ncbi:MAG: 4'-phosphopantetheinyl transferase [Cyclobacteriaceae bacterium]
MEPVFKDISDHSAYAIWCNDLSLEELEVDIYEEIPAELANYHPHKKAEYLASRILMNKLCEYMNVGYGGIRKDEHGKPHLQSESVFISISHSYPYIICMLDKQKHCGIDIELPRPQLLRIKHKFLNEQEQGQVGEDLELLCQYWSAKEALYKIHGRKSLAFSENIVVEQETSGSFTGTIKKNELFETHSLISEKIDNYFLVYNL